MFIIRALAVVALSATGALAHDLPAQVAASVLVPAQDEPPPRLTVGAPLPGPLARGAVLIPYRVEHLRIVPVLGAPAVGLSPRVGHLHVTLDDLPWRWADFSGLDTIVVNGLPAGEHRILIELADPEHRILAAQSVTFTVPTRAGTVPHASR